MVMKTQYERSASIHVAKMRHWPVTIADMSRVTNDSFFVGRKPEFETLCTGVLPGNDRDGDGILDEIEAHPTVRNADQLDLDMDNVGDACDNLPSQINEEQTDSDGDDVGDACDSCPNTRNPEQRDRMPMARAMRAITVRTYRKMATMPSKIQTRMALATCVRCPQDENDQADADLDRVGDVVTDAPTMYSTMWTMTAFVATCVSVSPTRTNRPGYE